MSVRFCCSLSDLCALAYPRHFRDQCTPDLLTLRDAYRADMVMHYPGVSESDLELHHAITAYLIAEITNELTLRDRGGVDMQAAAREARRYPSGFVLRVKAANDLIRVIVEDTGQAPPGRVGSSFRIRSPFRKDDTPSFHIYPDGHYYDYGTHEFGDVFTYVMRRHQVSFWQALEYLAVRAGIPIPEAPAALQKGGNRRDTGRWSGRKRGVTVTKGGTHPPAPAAGGAGHIEERAQ